MLTLCAAAACTLSLPATAQAPLPPQTPPVTGLDPLTVLATPLPRGGGVDIDKLPANVQTLSAHDLGRDGQSGVLPDAAAGRMGSVNLNDAQGSQYQPDLVYRGFEASPVSGVAQGLAVYQDGVRINESFGDTVNWDLVPLFAVNRLTVQGNNPVFGLNALGGAVTLEMKDGFNSAGTELELSGGSWGQLGGHGEYTARRGRFGLYAALGGVEDDGYRDHQPSALRQAYADLGYEDGRASLHLSIGGAANDIGALGPTPVQLLQQDARAVFTWPQAMRNEMGLVQLSGAYRISEQQQLGASTYYRRFRQRLVDGNTSEVRACADNADFFCLEGAGRYPDDALYDSNGRQVPTSALPAGATPGEIDRTATGTAAQGAALQWTLLAPLWRRDNHLAVGFAYDHGGTAYAAHGELGAIQPGLEVIGAGVIIDQSRSGTAQPPLEAPVSLRAANDDYGLYFSDTFNLSPDLAWTFGGRYNRAVIRLRDRLGQNLDGDHAYGRFNPGSGLSYKLAAGLTLYAGYSEANRAPTPGELSCANPDSPCLLGAFLVSDPELRQVVARTWEAGGRGAFSAALLPGSFRWNLGLFRTRNANDILLLATRVNGFGYFSNAGGTRRQGIESGLSWRVSGLELNASYSYLDASFRNALTLPSNSPSADADGNITVQPGRQIPLNPRQRLALQAEYSLAPRWKLGGGLRYVGGQYLAGDESNQQPRLPAYTVVDLHGSWQVRHWLRLFAGVDNLFDRSYYSYGGFTGLDGLPPSLKLSDPRTLSPGPGRAFFGGVHLDL